MAYSEKLKRALFTLLPNLPFFQYYYFRIEISTLFNDRNLRLNQKKINLQKQNFSKTGRFCISKIKEYTIFKNLAVRCFCFLRTLWFASYLIFSLLTTLWSPLLSSLLGTNQFGPGSNQSNSCQVFWPQILDLEQALFFTSEISSKLDTVSSTRGWSRLCVQACYSIRQLICHQTTSCTTEVFVLIF